MLHTNPTHQNIRKGTQNERLRNAHEREETKKRKKALELDNQKEHDTTFYVVKKVEGSLIYAQKAGKDIVFTKAKSEATHFTNNLATVVCRQYDAALEVV